MELPDNIELLKQIIRDQQTIITQLQLQITTLQANNLQLQHQVAKLQRLLFGQKSERRTKCGGDL